MHSIFSRAGALIFISVVLLLAASSALASVPSDFTGYRDNNLQPIEIGRLEVIDILQPAEFLRADPSSSIDNLPIYRFRPLRVENLNQGVTDAAFWVRFRVQNTQSLSPRLWVLYNEQPYLDVMDVYIQDQGAHIVSYHLSDREPFPNRPIDYKTLAVSHQTAPDSFTDVYVKMMYEKADTMTLGLKLADAIVFNKLSQSSAALQGIYFGLMIALIVIAVIMGIMLRQAVYWCYGVFITFSALMWGSLSGFAYQYLWPQWVWWHNEGFNIIFLLVAMTALQFSKTFLNTKNILPRWHLAMGIMQLAMVGAILLRLVGFYEEVTLISYVSLCTLALLSVVGWLAYRQGLKFARWYALAWLFYGAGLVLSVISASSDLFPWGMEPLAFAQLGSVIESALLLVAVAERLVMWEHDRSEAMQQALSDDLTELGNRRKLQAAYQEAAKRFTGDGFPEFLALLSVDRYDDILETMGHEAADTVLKDLGTALRNINKGDDVSVRYAGEEFVLLMEADSMRAAFEQIEAIRERFASSPSVLRGTFIPHTFTAGLTEVTEGGQFISQQEAIARAEEALKYARSQGGNCSVVYRRGIET